MNWAQAAKTLEETLALHRKPIGLHYQDEPPQDAVSIKGEAGCFVALLKMVEQGRPVAVTGDTGCFGGRFYCGFSGKPSEHQADYVSGEEHYIKTPKLCREIWADDQPLPAEGQCLVFQALENYGDGRQPEVIIILDQPDQISGLHFQASYDCGQGAVIAPFASGCGSIVAYPRLEAERGTHRAVLGMFDPSARAGEDPGILSFAVDRMRFEEMYDNIGESFLQHDAWQKIRKRHEK